MTPDDVMRDGRSHLRQFMAIFDGGTGVLVTEWWDDEGTVERTVSLRPLHGDFCDAIDLHQVKP